MKKLSLLVLIFCIIPFLASAGGFSFRDEFNTARTGAIHGTVTQANVKLSTINGASFVDFSQLGVLTNNVGKYIKICSVTNSTECVTGWIKAAGTAETLDNEASADAGFDNAGSWTLVEWAVAGSQATVTNPTSANKLRQDIASLTLGKLFKIVPVFSAKETTNFFGAGGCSFGTINISGTGAGTYTKYATVLNSNAHIWFYLAAVSATDTITSMSIKQVLTPSYTGVTIVSTSGGDTYNWATNTLATATSYNDTAGYTYTISTSATDANVVNASAAEPGSGTRTVVDTYATTELLTDTSFEAALTSGTCDEDGGNDNFTAWTETTTNGIVECTATGANVHSGSQAAKVTRTTGSTSISKTITVIPGRQYTLRFWTKGDGTNIGRYTVYDATNGYTSIVNLTDCTGSASAWTEVTTTFTAPLAGPLPCTSVGINLFSPAGNSSSAYFDDASLLPTSGLLSIADGKLTFAGGKTTAAWGDPELYFPSVTRAAGLSLISQLNSGLTTTALGLGFDTTAGSTITNNIMLSASSLVYCSNGPATPAVGTYTASTDYNVAVNLRASGHFCMIKGGTEYPTWKIAWIHASTTDATLIPTIAGNSKATTIPFLRIPTTLWLPTPIASDDFATTWGTTNGLGHAETTGIGSGGSGLTWASSGNTWSVSGGYAVNTPVAGEDIFGGNGAFTTDTYWSKGVGWTIDTADSNVAEKAAVASTDSIYKSATSVVGTWYIAQFDLVSYTSGGGVMAYIGNTAASVYRTVPATYITTNRAIGTYSGIQGFSTTVATVDNLTQKPLTLSELITTVPSSTANVLASVKIVATPNGTQAGVVTNVDSAASPTQMVLGYTDGANCGAAQLVDGTWTQLVNMTACTFAANAEIRAITDGTSYRLYYNNAQVSTTSTGLTATGTRHGMFSTYSGNQLNDFTLYARGTSGEYAILDGMMGISGGGKMPLVGIGK